MKGLGQWPLLLVLVALVAPVPTTKAAKLRPWKTSMIAGAAPGPRSFCGFASTRTKLYIFGGLSYQASATISNRLNDLHVFDTENLAWAELTASGIPPEGRWAMGFAAIDAQLYVFGGQSQDTENDLFVFDLGRGAWKELTDSVSGAAPRRRMKMGLVASDGLIYLFGGSYSGTVFNDLHVFDPTLLTWTDLTDSAVGSSPGFRSDFGMAVSGGKIYLFGGWTGTAYSNSMYELDPVLVSWTELSGEGALPGERGALGMAALGGLLYVFGGETATGQTDELYTFAPDTREWLALVHGAGAAEGPTARSAVGLAAAGEKVYLFGGELQSSGGAVGSNELLTFAPSLGTWTNIGTTGGQPPAGRQGFGMAALDAKIFVYGGKDIGGVTHSSDFLNDLHCFDLETMRWADLTMASGSWPEPSFGMGMTTVGRNLLVFGGEPNFGDILATTHMYNPTDMVWTDLTWATTGTPTGRFNLAISSIENRVYIFGGLDNSFLFGDTGDFDVFDLDEMTWKKLETASHPGARNSAAMVSAGGKLYLYGGTVVFQGPLNDMHMFDPELMTWTEIAATEFGRVAPGMAAWENRLIIFGGRNPSGDETNSMIEINLDDMVLLDDRNTDQSSLPEQRMNFGMVAAQGWIFIFGGTSGDSILSDFQMYKMPKTEVLTSFDTVAADLHLMSDGDAIALAPTGSFALHDPIELCVPGIPCSLRLVGHGASIDLHPGAMLVCDKLTACDYLWLDGVQLTCHGEFEEAPLQVLSGAEAFLTGTKVSGCHSRSNGGALVVRGGSEATVDSCTFENVHSAGSGGAIFLEGGRLRAMFTTFRMCTAGVHGGALLSSGRLDVGSCSFTDCATEREGGSICSVFGGNTFVTQTSFANSSSKTGGGAITSLGTLTMSQSAFAGCSSRGPGGALRMDESNSFISPSQATLDAVDSQWENCSSDQNGGAVSLRAGTFTVSSCFFKSNTAKSRGGGISVDLGKAEVQISDFKDNRASGLGGALSIQDGSVLLEGTFLGNNTAEGLGGGAIHTRDAKATLRGMTANGNRATEGGGGVLFWQGEQPTIERWSGGMCGAACPDGKQPIDADWPGLDWCEPCKAGTYKKGSQGYCQLCGAGFYASEGSSACSTCPSQSSAVDAKEGLFQGDSFFVWAEFGERRVGHAPVALMAAGENVTDGCEVQNGLDLSGSIAYMRLEGNCSHEQKCRNAEQAGAVACVVGADRHSLPTMQPDGDTPAVTIPAIVISMGKRMALEFFLQYGEMSIRIPAPSDTVFECCSEDALRCVDLQRLQHHMSNALVLSHAKGWGVAMERVGDDENDQHICWGHMQLFYRIPLLSAGSVGAASVTDCACNIGYGGAIAGRCTECAVGTFKTWLGPGDCTPCEAGWSKHSSGPGECLQCPSGSFSESGASSCVECPANSDSAPGATSVLDCICMFGYEGPRGGPCTGCEPGSFLVFTDGHGSQKCDSCPPGSFKSVAGPGPCLPCEEGKFAGGGASVCSSCPANRTSPAASVSISNCTCGLGFTGSDSGECTMCLAGKFKASSGLGACEECPPGQHKAAAGAGLCSECGAGTFAGWGSSACLACPEHSSSPEESTSLSDCTCDAGFGGDAGGSCVECGPGEYKPEGSNSCESCPPGSFKTSSGAGGCSFCSAEFYHDGSESEDTCLPCPEHSSSAAESFELSQCSCNLGYSGPNGGVCSACEAGKYKDAAGDRDCVPCPVGTFAVLPGSFECVGCPFGQYHSGNSLAAECESCPAGSVINPHTRSSQTLVVSCSSSTEEVIPHSCTTVIVVPSGATDLMLSISVEQTDFDTMDETIVSVVVGGEAVHFDPIRYVSYDLYGNEYYSGDFYYYGDYDGLDTSRCGTFLPIVDQLAVTPVQDSEGRLVVEVVVTTSAEVDHTPCSGLQLNAVVELSMVVSAAASSSTDCICGEGHTGPNGGPCALCEAGTFKDVLGDGGCQTCGVGTFTDAQGATECSSCPAGQHHSGASPDVASCSVCPLNSDIDTSGRKRQIVSATCSSGTEGDIPHSCNIVLEVPPDATDLLLSISVEQTDFDTMDETIASVVVGGQAVAFDPITYVFYDLYGGEYYSGDYYFSGDYDGWDTSRCGTFLPIVDQLAVTPVQDGGRQVVEVGLTASEEVDDNPCSGLYLRAEIELSFLTASIAPVVTDCVCNAGYEGPNGGPCIACEAGKVKHSAGPGSCVNCEGGLFKPFPGPGPCSPCQPGAFAAAGASNCSACEAGTYAGGPRAEACSPCRLGSFAEVPGASACSVCPAGQRNNGSSQAAMCLSCPPNAGNVAGELASVQRLSVNGNCFSTSGVAPHSCSTTIEVPADATDLWLSISVQQTDFDSLQERIESVVVQGQAVSHNPIAYVYYDGWLGEYYSELEGVGDVDDEDTSRCWSFLPVVERLEVTPLLDSEGRGFVNVDITASEEVDDYPCSGLYLNAALELSYIEAVTAETDTDCSCNAGYIGPNGGPCTPCEVGTFKNSGGDGECRRCALGSFADTPGAVACSVCPSGQYHDVASGCTSCPSHSSAAVETKNRQSFSRLCASSDSDDVPHSCSTSFRLPPYLADLKLSIRVEQTDFDSPDERIASVLVGGEAIDFYPIVYVTYFYYWSNYRLYTDSFNTYGDHDVLDTSVCGHFLDIVSDFPVTPSVDQGGYLVVDVDIMTTFFVDFSPCSGRYLNAEVELSFAEVEGPWSVQNCTCDPGSVGAGGGSPCEPCEAGTFHDIEGSGLCEACPPGSFKSVAGPGSCLACEEGKFAGGGASVCSSCPANSSAPAASVSISNCTCDLGFTGSDSGECTMCLAGKFKASSGLGACEECPPGQHKAAAGAGLCSECGAGTFAGWGSSACLACPEHSSSPEESTSLSDCTCDAGFGGDAGGPCVECRPGEYKPENALGLCVSCPSGHTSTLRSASCSPCPSGTFADTQASSCVTCPPNTRLKEADGGTTDCQCAAGFEGPDGGPCSLCTRGTYKAGTGPGPCQTCPENSLSAPGSRGRHECQCMVGFTGSPEGHCVPCTSDQECNDAVYGPCVASDFRGLEVSGPGVVRAGQFFTVTARKTDFYSQQVASDSLSVLSIEDASLGGDSQTGLLEIVGARTLPMRRGEVGFDIAVRPAFSAVDATQGTTQLVGQPGLIFRGQDADSTVGTEMVSDAVHLNFSLGAEVCEQGSVLQLEDGSTGTALLGTCRACGAESYSLNPLLSGGNGSRPSCLQCPVGLECRGGADVSPKLGEWVVDEGEFRLVSCPGGHQLVSSTTDGEFSAATQHCIPCESNQYIVDPNKDECQDCPVGGVCEGAVLRGVQPGSVWSVEGSFRRLAECPAGFVLVRDDAVPAQDQCVSCPAESYSWLPARVASGAEPERMVASSAVAAASGELCTPCPLGAVCSESSVQARKGWWVDESLQRRSEASEGEAAVYKCPPKACEEGNKCANGRVGPVCGLCK